MHCTAGTRNGVQNCHKIGGQGRYTIFLTAIPRIFHSIELVVSSSLRVFPLDVGIKRLLFIHVRPWETETKQKGRKRRLVGAVRRNLVALFFFCDSCSTRVPHPTHFRPPTGKWRPISSSSSSRPRVECLTFRRRTKPRPILTSLEPNCRCIRRARNRWHTRPA